MSTLEQRRREAGGRGEWLTGSSELARLIRECDWAATPLGHPVAWPESLRMMVGMCLESRFPMAVFWGPELVQLYNDAFRPILGQTKHPGGLGQRAEDCWREIWDSVGPMLRGVLDTGEGVWARDALMLLDRNNYVEETYFTFSYSAIREDSGDVSGVLCTVAETTEEVLASRRLAALSAVAAAAARAATECQACELLAAALSEAGPDLPFALLYRLSDDHGVATLAFSAGLEPPAPEAPARVAIGAGEPRSWPALLAVARGSAEATSEPVHGLGPSLLLRVGIAGDAILVAGRNPQRALDHEYRRFLRLVAGHVGTALEAARSREAERMRAEELEALDRAKTEFFMNVSHEFRTPLTLMLGPLEEALALTDEREQRERLEMIQRNTTRLRRLVFTLLDFSRLQAGRAEAVYEPTDLGPVTAEVASAFRSAVERAGLRYLVDCPPLGESVYVDRDMWEKVVLNLISNALKFTFRGEIAVRLALVGEAIILTVADTGIGIQEQEQEHLFERFYRVRDVQARTREGTGIGLALVQEIVALHGGSVAVDSEPARGSTFTVRLPRGRGHVPAGQVRARPGEDLSALDAAAYVEEASRWLAADRGPVAGAGQARVLVADDNADMRTYLSRLLRQRWGVEAVADGATALAAARERPPDLVLADVMMPGMDGLHLLRELRADERTREIPVILLSARAGEEAALEGLAAGADNYLAKPFSARELTARVDATLELSRLRRRAASELREERQRLEQTLQQLPAGVILAEAPSGRIVLTNQQVEQILGHRLAQAADLEQYGAHGWLTLEGKPLAHERWPLARAIRAGEVVRDEDMQYQTGTGKRIVIRVNAAPIRDDAGTVFAGVAVFQDVTDHVRTERLFQAQRDILAAVAAGEPLARTLERITRTIERLKHDDAHASILLASADGRRLVHGAAPNLPDAYNDAIDGIEIGPAAGSCGTAAHRRETVIVSDTYTDPLWRDFRELVAQYGLRACWSTPILAADGELVGTFAVYHSHPHQPSDASRRIVDLLARTAAVAIERDRDARARERRLSELQTILLPRALPQVPGVEVAAAFFPATGALDVGGDFYDLFPLPDGSFGFVIGDVCGHGAPAAAVTSLTRHTTRAIALLKPVPAQVLAAVNEALRVSADGRFCTAIYGRLEPQAAGARVKLACAGHPAPLLRRLSGHTEAPAAHGPLLGVLPDPAFPEITLELGPGDALLLYTDGLIERNPHLTGVGGLREVVACAQDPHAGGMIEQITQRALGPEPRRLRDDVAMLLLRPSRSLCD